MSAAYGLHSFGSLPVARFARHVEALGFDYLACGEHVMFHRPAANAIVTLAAAAGATTRVRLLSSIVLAPLYPAALLAKMATELDVVSDGRFTLGVGVGGEFAKEFEACGVPVSERGARADEALEVVHRLLTEHDVSFEGAFNRLSGVTIEPPPVQRPRPPIWVGGRSGPAIRRAARFADVWLPYFVTPERLERDSAALAAAAAWHGRADSEPGTALFAFATVYRDGDRARRVASERLGEIYQQDFSALVGRYAITGSVADCRARLDEYLDAGAGTAVLSLACPPEDADAMARLLAEEVLGLEPRQMGGGP